MKQQILKNIKYALAIGLVATVLIGMARFEVNCQELRDNVFRLHIKANSDSTDDQALKLKVRDALLTVGEQAFKSGEDIDSAVATARQNLSLFYETAKSVIEENGYDYDVEIDVGTAYFDTRVYDEFTLPAGEYQALNVKIGAAQGKNWWCVMFPALCLPSASAELNDAVSDESAQIAQNGSKYILKFKTVEIYEQLKRLAKAFKPEPA